MDVLSMSTKESQRAAAQPLPSSHHAWLSDYLSRLQVMWWRTSMPAQAVLLLVDRHDYPGSLVLSLLRSREQLTQVLTDSRATVGYAPRSFVEDTIRLVYDSLSLEFTPPEMSLLAQASQAILVFADGEVSVSDGRIPLNGAVR